MDIRPVLSCAPCVTSPREKTGYIITFAHIKEGNLLSKTCNDAESGEETDVNSIMPPLLIKEEMDSMDSGYESDDDDISTEMLENIRDGSQSRPSINRRKARYKIHYHIKQRQLEWKGSLRNTRNVGKGFNHVFKTVVKEISQ